MKRSVEVARSDESAKLPFQKCVIKMVCWSGCEEDSSIARLRMGVGDMSASERENSGRIGRRRSRRRGQGFEASEGTRAEACGATEFEEDASESKTCC